MSSSVSSMENGVENLWRRAYWNQLTFVVNCMVLHEAACVLARSTLCFLIEGGLRLADREQKMSARDLPSNFIIFIINLPSDFSRSQSGFASSLWFILMNF